METHTQAPSASLYRPLAVAAALSALGMGMLAPILPAYALTLGASLTSVGLLFTSFGLARLLVPLPAVWLARRLGRRPLLMGGLGITVPFAVLCALASGMWTLIVFCLGEGVAAAVFATVGNAVVAESARPEQRGRALAGYQAAGLFGASLGPVVGGQVGERFGMRVVFLVYAGCAAAGVLWLQWRLDRHVFAPESTRRTTRLPAAEPGWRALTRFSLLPLWLLAFSLVFTRVGVQLVAAPLLGARQLGLTAGQIGLALSLSGFVALGAFYPAGWLADHYGRKVAIVPGGLAMVGALAVFATSGNYPEFLGAAMILGLGSGLAGPGPAAYLADVLTQERRAAGVAVYRTTGDAGATLAPVLLGRLAEQGGYSVALLGTGLLMLVATVAFFWLTSSGAESRSALQTASTPA